MATDELRVTDLKLEQEAVEVTAFGDTERKYLPMDTKVTLSGTLSNSTAGWFGTNTATMPTFNIVYTENGTGTPTLIQQPQAFWEPAKPKTKSKKSNDPLDWLHSRVDEICDRGYLDV